MANSDGIYDKIHIYSNITENNPLGQKVSTGDISSPIYMRIKFDDEQESAIKLGVRCDYYYHTLGDTTICAKYRDGVGVIHPSGGTSTYWKFCEDHGFSDSNEALLNGDWQDKLVITDKLTDSANHFFWAKVSSNNKMSASFDTKTVISAEAVIELNS